MKSDFSIGRREALRALGCTTLLGLRLAASSTGTGPELTLGADLDGDGRTDTILVDRASGAYRIGYQLGAGAFTWVEARASGIEGVSGVSAGRLLEASKDALVFTSPEANRVNVVAADSPLDAGEPLSVFPAGVGPVAAIALDIPGNLNTALDDLAVFLSDNGLPNPGRLAQVRDVGGVFSPLSEGALDAVPLVGARVQVKSGGENLLGVLEQSGNSRRFRVLRAGALPPAVVVQADVGNAEGFAFGRFTGAPQVQFLFLKPGETSVRARAVSEPQAGQFQLGAAQVLELGMPLGEVTVLATTPARILAVAQDGAEARVFSWNGNGAPVQVQALSAPPGESLRGALAMPDGGFLLFRGDAGAVGSTRWETFRVQGGVHVGVGGGALPVLNPRSLAANVFLFADEPFVAPQPRLLRSLNAADWVNSISFGGNPAQVGAVAERFGTSAQGLDNPAARALGPVPAGALFSLANQIRPMMSMVSFLPASGDQPVTVQALPSGGFRRSAVAVNFQPVPVTAQVRYRLDAGGGWKLSDGKPLTLVSDTLLEFYAQLPGSEVKSPIQRASYVFEKPSGGLDTDGDGVPDFVEKARGLDPAAGADTDGDGFTDKNELLVGTDPLNANPKDPKAVPQDAERLDEDGAYDVAVGPRPMNGANGQLTTVAVGSALELHAVGGGRVGQGVAGVLGLAGVPDPAIRFADVQASAGVLLLSVSTDPHFDVQTGGPDKRIGRELVGLVRPPETPVTPVDYVPGNGTAEQEATAWLNAAKAAQQSSPRVVLKRELAPVDSLVALLLERRVNELLVTRAVAGFTPTNLTLFPFRSGDSSRRAATAEELIALRQRLDAGRPGHDVGALLGSIEAAVRPPGLAALNPLRALVQDIYALSSRSNNVHPGQFDLPVDVIRGFLRTGQLPATYAGVTSVSPADRTAAFNAAKALLESLPSRPTALFDLTVTEEGAGGECTVLVETVSKQPRNLVVDGGAPFQFPQAFELIPGSRVEVFAYTDAPASGCAGVTLEVISASLLSIPPAPVVDANANFLADDWECFFLGGGVDPYGDSDGDGFSELQEFLDGTDPKDAASKSQKAAKLDLPPIGIGLKEGGGIQVKFQYPPQYAPFFQFALEAAPELGQPFVEQVIAVPDGQGQVSLLLPAVQKVREFYRVTQRRK